MFVDDGPWLLLLAMPLLALLFRRGWLLMLVLCVHSVPVQAVERNWWQRPEQQARQAFEAGRFADVDSLTPQTELAASAAYRRGDYTAAAQGYAKFDNARAHYNRGNALAKAGLLGEALHAYDQALEKEPGMADALANRKLVEEALEQQEQADQQSSERSAEQSGQADNQSEQGEQGKNGEGQQDNQSKPSGQDSEQSSDADSQPSPSDAAQGSQQNAEAPDQDAQQNADTSADDSPPAAGDQASSEQQAEQRDALEQAQRQAMEQALQEQSDQQAEPERVPAIGSNEQPVDPQELEKMQALEQLLRRVPDDPGALLKRKFALEHRRRVLEGEQQ